MSQLLRYSTAQLCYFLGIVIIDILDLPTYFLSDTRGIEPLSAFNLVIKYYDICWTPYPPPSLWLSIIALCCWTTTQFLTNISVLHRYAALTLRNHSGCLAWCVERIELLPHNQRGWRRHGDWLRSIIYCNFRAALLIIVVFLRILWQHFITWFMIHVMQIVTIIKTL